MTSHPIKLVKPHPNFAQAPIYRNAANRNAATGNHL